MNPTSQQAPPQEHLIAVAHYLIDCVAAQSGPNTDFGAVQPKPPTPHALQSVCEFLQQSGS